MKREIKFRAWDDGKMVYEKDITHLHLEDSDILRLAKFWCNIRSDSIPMQFTGLHDKNGKEIYDGDIVKHGESIRFIEFRDCRILAIRPCKTEAIMLCFSENPEVIGNIYENPELINT